MAAELDEVMAEFPNQPLEPELRRASMGRRIPGSSGRPLDLTDIWFVPTHPITMAKAVRLAAKYRSTE